MCSSEEELLRVKRALIEKISKGQGNFSLIQKRTKQNKLALSFAQTRIWFLEQLLPDSSVYNISGAIKITGKINVEVLNRAITDIINRHESLRTEFIVEDAVAVQNIIDTLDRVDIPIIDLKQKDIYDTDIVYDVMNEDAGCNIDISKAPLVKLKLFCTKDDEYYFFINMHHIISDGWSLGVFQKEIVTEYCRHLENINPPLREMDLQYGDFSEWQNKRIINKQLEKQLEYWKKKLENVTVKTDFPYDKVRKAVTDYKGKRIPVCIPVHVVEKMKLINQKLNTTNFMFLLSALNIMQFKYSGETDVTVGCPVANRNQKQIEELIGFFVNTLVIRTNIDKEVTFRELLNENKKNSIEAYSNQDIPFEMIVERLQPDRKMSVNSPLFQTGFVFQNTPIEKTEIEGLSIEIINVFNGMSIFELLLSLTEKEGRIEGFFEYSTDLYEEETIKRIARQYEQLIGEIVNNLDIPISKLQMLTDEEREALISCGKRKENHYSDICIHEQFELIAEKFSDKIAVKFEDTVLTYGQLNRYADALASELVKNGIKEGELVGIYMERSIEMLVAIVAVLKVGGAYVPINTLYPPKRVEYIVEDAELRVVLVHGDDVNKNISCNCDLWEVELDNLNINESVYYEKKANCRNGAYVIYTSGSTGNPKGVIVEHYNVLRLFAATDSWFHFSEKDTWTLFHSHAFDFSVWEIWGALLYGGTLVVVPYYISRSVSEFYDLVSREKVTVLNQTPSAFKQFMAIDLEDKNKKLDKLKYIIFGGEALDIQSLNGWFEKYGDNQPQIINMYGITETTVHVTYRPIKKEDLLKSGSNIGEPIPDLDLYLVDENINLVPMGMPGEICVGGDGVARGYLKRPELTEKKFIQNPFSNDGSRLYRSGDLARYNSKGEFEFLGRIDTQIKIRGFRLELGEIENVLKEQEEIKDAVVAVKKNSIGIDKLVGYVIEVKMEEDEKEHDSMVANQWSSVFNQTYEETIGGDNKFNIIGWNSLYNNENIPEDEMKKWVDATIDLIKEKLPKSVLEVGCGTGLLLYRIAQGCSRYVGTDISETAINNLKNNISNYKMLELYCQPADIMNNITGKFDTVIINSVIQYFPSPDYLIEVIKKYIKVINDNGTLILGDIRNLESIEIFYRSIEKYKSERILTEDELKSRVKNRLDTEHELIISPEFFFSLKYHIKEITGIEIRLKKGNYINELSQFRYDVILHINNKNIESIKNKVMWDSISGIEDIRELLNPGLEHLLITHIPNKRLQEFDQSGKISKYIDPAVFEETVCPGYKTDIMWAGTDKTFYFDILIKKETLSDFIFEIDCGKLSHNPKEYINNPINEVTDDKRQIKYKEYLKKKLPDYMVPDNIIILNSFPLTFNGKIDTKSLPMPEKSRADIKSDYVEPVTKYEKALTKIWKDILGIENIGINDNFFDLGGHSLLATQVIFKIKDLLKVRIPLKLIFEAGTIKEIAKAIETKDTNLENLTDVDFYNEVKLKYPIIKKNYSKIDIDKAEYILLTGSTGFLGAFLLKSLMEKTCAKIICLIRGEDKTSASERLKNNLFQYSCYDVNFESRIDILCGDLSKEMLGLTETEFIELSQKVSVIYHNGNLVNFMAPYSEHKAANVDGLQEIIKLMGIGCKKEMHYVSTTHVFSPSDACDGIIYEEKEPEHPYELTMGYTQSKWVAEGIIKKAVQEGLRINIYRPGRIWGDCKNGICQKNDFMWLLIETAIQTKMAPEMDIDLNVIPADFLADSIVNISKLNSTCTAYNMVNTNSLHWNDIMSYLVNIGYKLNAVTMSQWKEEIESFIRDDKQVAIYSLLPILDRRGTDNEARAVFCNKHMLEGIKEYNMVCPHLDFELFKKYVDNRRLLGRIE